MSQQREVHVREETIMQLNDSLRAAQERTRQAEVQAEVSKLSEERLIAQQAELREELKKQSALSESVYRIESSLANRMQQEREELKNEVESLQHTLDKVRREHSETIMMHEQKIQTQEEELRILRGSLEQRADSISSLREDLARERGLTETAQERAAVLEKQLTIAQDRLSSIQGIHSADSILAAENAQREVDLDQARSECEALRTQLQVAEKHADQYRKISATTESLLKDLRERSAASRSAHEQEIAALKSELDTLKNEMSERRESTMMSVKEAEEARAALSEASKKHEEDLAALRNELVLAKEAQARVEEQMEVLKSDTAVFEAAAKEATSNYERELTMHAQVASQLRKVESNLDSVKSELASTKQKMAELSATCIRAEKALEDERARSKAMHETAKEEAAALRHTNDLLHSQVQTMSLQVSRLENERMRKVSGDDGKEGEVVAGASSEEVSDELIEMRQASAELRDVVRYMKRERDMLEAKLSLTETEKNRYIAESASTQKALDESRAELKREIESRSQNARSEDEFAKLMQEITQLNVVRESNAHLRSENMQLKSSKDELQRAVDAAREQIQPLNEKVIRLEANLQTMETERLALVNDAAYWKDRLHQLVSRYNDVDPEEHRELKEKLQQTEAELVQLREQAACSHSTLEETKKNLVSTENSLAERVSELSASRTTAEIMEKNSENLRAKLREYAKQIKDLRQQNGELNATVKQKQEDVEKAQNDAKAANARANAVEPAAVAPKAPPVITPVTPAVTGTPVVRKTTPAVPPPSGPPPPITPTVTVDSVPAIAENSEGTAAPTSSAADLQSLRVDLLRRMAETRMKKNAGAAAAAAPATTDTSTVAAKHSAPEDDEREAPNAKRARTNTEGTAPTAPTAPAPAAPVVASKASAAPLAQGGRPQKLMARKKCHFFTSPNGCKKGDACPYLHELDPSVAESTTAPAAVEAETAPTATEPVETVESVDTMEESSAVVEEVGTEGADDEDIVTGEIEGEAVSGDNEEELAAEEVEVVEEDLESANPTPFSVEGTGETLDEENISESSSTALPTDSSVPAPSVPKFGSVSSAVKVAPSGPFSAGFKGTGGAAGGGIFGSGLKGAMGSAATGSTNLFQAFAAKKAAGSTQSSPFASKPLNPFAVNFSPHKSVTTPAPAEPTPNSTEPTPSSSSELSVSIAAANASENAAPASSPFMNLRPPSPSSSAVRIQFGSGNKSLPIPSNVPALAPTTSSGLFTKSFSGGSLFNKTVPGSSPAPSPAQSPANVPSTGTGTAGELSTVGQPVRALPLFSSLKKSVPSASPSSSSASTPTPAAAATTWSQISTQPPPDEPEEADGEGYSEEPAVEPVGGAATIVSTTV